jgi:hypothetical protein
VEAQIGTRKAIRGCDRAFHRCSRRRLGREKFRLVSAGSGTISRLLNCDVQRNRAAAAAGTNSWSRGWWRCCRVPAPDRRAERLRLAADAFAGVSGCEYKQRAPAR